MEQITYIDNGTDRPNTWEMVAVREEIELDELIAKEVDVADSLRFKDFFAMWTRNSRWVFH